MDIRQLHGMQLDEYELVEIIGQGGMSAVYRAYQEELDRDVAVKILSDTLAQDSGYVQRFTNEAKMAASLEHPHIVPVYDFGVVDDLSYVVMRLLNNGTLKDRLDRGDAFSASAVMHIVTAMAKALDYAHTRRIVHRDVKPGNIMFDEQETPYLVDFGIAKAAHAADGNLTAEQTVIGTPAYMAPEQWQNKTLTPATDQYALAVVVFWILTGKLPFNGDTSTQLMYQHLNEAPPRADSLNSKLPASISDVLDRALAKDPDERYPSVTNFNNALRNALGTLSATTAQNLAPVRPDASASSAKTQEHPQVQDVPAENTVPHEQPAEEPTIPAQSSPSNQPQDDTPKPVPPPEYERQAAMPPRSRPRPQPQDAPPRQQQTMLRQIATGGAIGLTLLTVLVIGGGVILYNLIAPAAPDPTPAQSTTVPTQAANAATAEPTPITVVPRNTAAPNGGAPTGSGALNPQSLQQTDVLIENIQVPIRDVAYSPDGRFIAAADGEGRIQFWRNGSRSEWTAHSPVASAVDFSSDSTRLISGGRDNTAIIWDTATGNALVTLRGHTSAVRDVAYSPNGGTVATAGEDGTVRIWNASNGTVQRVISADPTRVLSVTYSPDSQTIASGGRSSDVIIWDVGSGSRIATLRGHSEEIRSVAFSPDGQTLVSSSTDNTVRLWDVQTRQIRATLTGHTNDVFVVTVSPDSAMIISGGRSGTVRLWDASSGDLLRTLDAHNGWVLGVDVRPDNSAVLSGGGDGAVRVWSSR